MELFKMMEAEDRRNRSCKSTLKKKSIIVTNNRPLQLCLTYMDETMTEEPENFTLRKLLERKLAVFKVLYPFLPLDQIRGKVLQSLHLPPRWDSKENLNLDINSLDPLMMTDYSNYFIHLLSTLHHTTGPLKVANEPLAQVNEKSAKKPNTRQIPSAKFFSSPTASEHSKEEPTPSLIVPLGERNLNQNAVTMRSAPMKRKSTFTIRSVAGTSDNASEFADSIILPVKNRKIAKPVVYSTPVKPPVTKSKNCPSVISSVGTVENQMLPPTPPRRRHTQALSGSPRAMPPPANRTRVRPGTPMRPIQLMSPTLSDQTCEDSIIVNVKFHAITKSPPPKLKSEAQSCGNAISEVSMKGFIESSSKQASAFDYLSDEEEEDQLGLPIADCYSKVRHFLRTSVPTKSDDGGAEEEI